MSLPTERMEVDSKGRIVIPSRYRKALSIKTGDMVELFLYGKNSLVLRLLSPEPYKTICIGCGKTEDDVKMHTKTNDGRYGICERCRNIGV